jgi:predicted acyltransferase
LPGRLWKYTWDPEGLLSTLPAIGSGLIGMCAGYILLKKDILENRLNQLFFGIGNCCSFTKSMVLKYAYEGILN